MIFFAGGILWFVMAYDVIKSQVPSEYETFYESDAYTINLCDTYYYEKNYDKLYYVMQLYDTYYEDYDMYWEVVNAYIDYMEYEKWTKVSETDIEDAREMEAFYRDEVISASQNCEFPQNQKHLDGFVEMLEQ